MCFALQFQKSGNIDLVLLKTRRIRKASPIGCVGFEAKYDILACDPDRRTAFVRVRFLLDK